MNLDIKIGELELLWLLSPYPLCFVRGVDPITGHNGDEEDSNLDT